MASARARQKLARAAWALNEAAAHGARRLPALILMTDDVRVADPVAAAKLLPRGSAVVLRHRSANQRECLARELAAVARKRRLVLLIAGDPDLAQRVAADGLHAAEKDIRALSRWRTLHPKWLVTSAAHSQRAACAALRAGADAVLMAPVFPTSSHPGAAVLGPLRLRNVARHLRGRVYALGGIGELTVRRLEGAPLAGIAAIEALLSDQRS